MALINPKTGSSQFNAVVRRNAVISLAGEVPTIVSEEEEFGIKLISDAISGEELSHKDLEEVPDDEIGADGIWINAQAAKLKELSQEELIAMVLQLQSGAVAATEETVVVAEEEAEETVEEPVEDKPKRKRKKPAPRAETPDVVKEVEEVKIDAASKTDEEIEDVEF